MRGSDWFVIRTSPEPRTCRLICVPNAGSGVFAFRGWPEALPDIEVVIAHLPGRDGRREIPQPESLHAIAGALATASDDLRVLPTIIFGHSMGALIALELARELTRKGRAPAGLIASGRRAPSTIARFENIGHLPDREFLDAVQQRYGGIPAQVLEDEDLRALFVPTLRADMRLVESYVSTANKPLSCPIVAYGGDGDPQTSRDELEEWRGQTTGPFGVRVFSGGHFFVETAREAVFSAVRADVGRALRDRVSG